MNARKKMLLLTMRDPKLRYNPSERKFNLDRGYETRMLEFAKNLGPDDMEVLNLFCKAYMDLLNDEKLYTKQEEFDKYLAENLEVYEEDKTLGLVKQLLPSFHLRKLKQLKKVYYNYSLK